MIINGKQFIILIILIVLIVIGTLAFGSRYYELRDDFTLDKLSPLLLTYGIISMVIERFVNNVMLSEGNQKAKMARRKIRKLGLDSESLKQVEYQYLVKDISSNNFEFSWMSFGVSALVSSFGFKFFNCVFQVAGSNPVEGINLYLDIFLTGVMLAGGASFIKAIGDLIGDRRD